MEKNAEHSLLIVFSWDGQFSEIAKYAMSRFVILYVVMIFYCLLLRLYDGRRTKLNGFHK